ncbi:MAG: phosphatidylglycerol lysyltransferase domain-containing protein [Helicobacter sp.]|nr:phosphatidylglycerol lysyltransferase domain-containing protein [Helicobacter sp.]
MGFDFKPLELSDCEVINGALAHENVQIGDITFVNLYIWRHARDISFANVSNCILVRTMLSNKEHYYFFPKGSGDKKAVIADLLSQDKEARFSALTSEEAEFLQVNFPNRFQIILNEDRSDYIYSTNELINLSGRKFHKKKNHLNQFIRANPDFTYEAFNSQNIAKVIQKQHEWLNLRNDNEIDLANLKFEHLGIIDVLENFDVLVCSNLRGGAICVDGEIVAFSFGEIINPKMCLIHIEKGSPFVHGAYQAINQQFLKHEFADTEFVNREEDLGLEGLRKAKLSYNPLYLLKKFEATIIY